jgi:hypothetical protein
MSQQEPPATDAPEAPATSDAPTIAEAPPSIEAATTPQASVQVDTPPSEGERAAPKAQAVAEPRIAARKMLTCRVKVSLQSGAALSGKAVDISLTGIGVIIPDAIPAGSVVTIGFDPLLNGKSTPISLPAKAVYSSLGSKGFRIGFQFVRLNDSQTAALEGLLSSPLAS